MKFILSFGYLGVIDKEYRNKKNYCQANNDENPFWIKHDQQWNQKYQQME